MGDLDASLNAYQNAVRHNRSSVEAHTRIAAIARGREELTEVRLYILFLTSIPVADGRFCEARAAGPFNYGCSPLPSSHFCHLIVIS